MGLEDRDWYREQPSEEWNKRRPPERSRSTSKPVPKRPSSEARSLEFHYKVAGFGLGVVITLIGWQYRHDIQALSGRGVDAIGALSEREPSAAPPAPLTSDFDATTVRLRNKRGLDVPARTVSRWTLTDPRFGTVEVIVPVGKTPREALTIALAERGYQVVR